MHCASLAGLPAPQVSPAQAALLPVPHPPTSPTAHRKKSRQISSNTTQYVDLLAVPVCDSYLPGGKREGQACTSQRYVISMAMC